MSSGSKEGGTSGRKRPSPLQVSGADRALAAKARERWRDPTDWRRIIEMSLVLWDAAPEAVEEWLQRMGRKRDLDELDVDQIWREFVAVVESSERAGGSD